MPCIRCIIFYLVMDYANILKSLFACDIDKFLLQFSTFFQGLINVNFVK